MGTRRNRKIEKEKLNVRFKRYPITFLKSLKTEQIRKHWFKKEL